MKQCFQRALGFAKSEAVLSIAALLAVGSMAAVPPDKGYLDYIDWDTLAHACDAERRTSDDCTLEGLLRDNALALEACREHGAAYILIDQDYHVDF